MYMLRGLCVYAEGRPPQATHGALASLIRSGKCAKSEAISNFPANPGAQGARQGWLHGADVSEPGRLGRGGIGADGEGREHQPARWEWRYGADAGKTARPYNNG